MNKSQIASLGGQAVVKKYGSEYMREIGKKGARSFHTKYALKPVGTVNFAIVRRSDNVIVNTVLRSW